MKTTIEKLSEKTLRETLSLLYNIFNNKEEERDYPGKWLPYSLNKNSEEAKKAYKENKTTDTQYWIAKNEEEKVIGVIGYYAKEWDKEAHWVGWFAVDKKYRGTGVAQELMKVIIKETKNKGRKYLRLYTSDDEVEAAAQVFYKKLGFHITKTEPSKIRDELEIHMELDLSSL